MDRPNILYIHSHDTGRYIQPYGYGIATPHLQNLAEEGVLFRQAFCAGPTCSPSRAGLVTGQPAHSAGMIGLAHRGFSLNDYSRHLACVLRQRGGYHTAISGFEHVGWRRQQPDTYDQDLGGADDRADEAAVEFLKNAPDRQPFFLAVGFSQTHRLGRNFVASPDIDAGEPPRTDPRYIRPPAPLPDTPDVRRDIAAYADSALDLDRRMGNVFRALDEAGLTDNTLVIATTDHGIAFPKMKCNLTDHGIGVMLILRGPGGFTGGKVIDAMVSQVDLFPTICDLAGIDRPDWLTGSSVRPLVTGEVDRIHDEIFSEVTYHAAYEPKRCIRTERWKYIRRYDDRRRPVLPNIDNSLSKDLYLDSALAEQPPAPEQLYDLAGDPNEACDLAGSPGYRDVLDDLRRRLDRWMQETNDPLREGPVAAPRGAEVNDPDGLHPEHKTHKAQ
ncbi:MAG: sulfatase [Phycisphaerae bacterium]